MILTLGPLLAGASLAISSYLAVAALGERSGRRD